MLLLLAGQLLAQLDEFFLLLLKLYYCALVGVDLGVELLHAVR